jgi:hypothetical protein
MEKSWVQGENRVRSSSKVLGKAWLGRVLTDGGIPNFGPPRRARVEARLRLEASQPPQPVKLAMPKPVSYEWIFLGTGTSSTVPSISCITDPKNGCLCCRSTLDASGSGAKK